MEIKRWILDWFKKNTKVDVAEIENNIDANYFEKKWIDSITFIQFLDDIENEFQISFSNDVFQDRSFATISGLVRIIGENK